jgi:predicted enzyme related to lactoylglutathione lyase
MAGEIVHLELPSRSFERSAEFYGKIFGWRAGARSGGHLRFETSPAAPGHAGSGAQGVRGSWVLHALAQAPGPLPFVAVDDIGATLAEVERQGGRILVPRLSLAGQGEFGLLADPDGNVIAVTVRSGGGTDSASEIGAGAPPPQDVTAPAVDEAKAPAARPPVGVRAKTTAVDKPAQSQPKSAAGARASSGKASAKAAPRRKR